MRIVGISCVKDEVDIVEPFVRHALALVDHLVILDNGSSDGTRAILAHLAVEGLPLEIVDDPAVGHYQRQRMTMLLRDYAIARHRADWIVPLDADEFLAGEPVRATLPAHTTDRPVGLPWRNYVPQAVDDQNERNPVRRIRHRIRRETQRAIKVAIPAALFAGSGFEIDQGNHHVLQHGVPIAPVGQNRTWLAHFPGRSVEQFAVKVAKTSIQYAAMHDREPTWGNHHALGWNLLRRSYREFAEAFPSLVVRYSPHDDGPFRPEIIADPVQYLGGELRHTPPEVESQLIRALMDLSLKCGQSMSEMATRCDEQILQQSTMLQNQYVDKLACLNAAVAEQSAAIAALQSDAANLRRSWSWRIGRVVLSPVRGVKALLGRAA